MPILIVIFFIVLSASTSAQAILARNNTVKQKETMPLEKKAVSTAEEKQPEMYTALLKAFEKKAQQLEKRNEDLAKENHELKTKLLTLQINGLLQAWLQPAKTLKLEHIEEIVYDY